MNFKQALKDELTYIEQHLIEKNNKYGNSALQPKRIFSRAGAEEQLNVRIDDKLSRIENCHSDDEDTILDLIGYLILKRIHAKSRQKTTVIIS